MEVQTSPGGTLGRHWPACPQGCYLADVVPEDGLVVRASQLPLEPGLWLSVVGDLRRRGSVLDLREVRHGVSHCDGSEGAGAQPAAEVMC